MCILRLHWALALNPTGMFNSYTVKLSTNDWTPNLNLSTRFDSLCKMCKTLVLPAALGPNNETRLHLKASIASILASKRLLESVRNNLIHEARNNLMREETTLIRSIDRNTKDKQALTESRYLRTTINLIPNGRLWKP